MNSVRPSSALKAVGTFGCERQDLRLPQMGVALPLEHENVFYQSAIPRAGHLWRVNELGARPVWKAVRAFGHRDQDPRSPLRKVNRTGSGPVSKAVRTFGCEDQDLCLPLREVN
jgi:hypothetical protein